MRSGCGNVGGDVQAAGLRVEGHGLHAPGEFGQPVRAAVWSRSCFSRVASRYSATRSRVVSAAFVAAAMASAPFGLCLNQRRPCSVL